MYRYTKKDKNPRWFELISRFLSRFSLINWDIILFATKNNSQNTNYGITSMSDILLRLSLFFKACSSKINWTFYDSRKLQNISSNYYMKAKHMQKHYESLFGNLSYPGLLNKIIKSLYLSFPYHRVYSQIELHLQITVKEKFISGLPQGFLVFFCLKR